MTRPCTPLVNERGASTFKMFRLLGALGTLAVWVACGAVLPARAAVNDFEANNGLRLANYRVYTPPMPDDAPIRGVIFVFPGSGTDYRFFADDLMFQAAARSTGFAIIGATNTAGFFDITEAQAAQGLDNILTAAAGVSGHSELVNAPIVSTGFSYGGITSTALAGTIPDRMISVVAHKGATQSGNPPAAQYVQQLWIPGSSDGNSYTRPSVQMELFKQYRGDANPNGQAAFAVDWRGVHTVLETPDSPLWSMQWTWIAETVSQRYPENTAPSTEPGNPVTLVNQPLETGWLGERAYVSSTTGADHSSFLTIAPYDEYAGDKANASWMPTETAARAYRAFSSFDDNYSRTDEPRFGPLVIDTGDETAWSMISKTTGSILNMQVDPREFDDVNAITRMEYYDGSTLVGVQTAPHGDGTWSTPVTLDSAGIHTLTVVATDSLGNQTSTLRTVVVNDPSTAKTILFDAGLDAGVQVDSEGRMWNSYTGASASSTAKVSDAKDSAGVTTPVSLYYRAGGGVQGAYGVTDSTLTDAPEFASADGHAFHTSSFMTLEFNGLDPDAPYLLTVYGSRNAGNTNRVTEVYLGDASSAVLLGVFDADGVGLEGIARDMAVTADSLGRLFITIKAASDETHAYAHLNAIELTLVPEPASLALLAGAASLMLLCRRGA